MKLKGTSVRSRAKSRRVAISGLRKKEFRILGPHPFLLATRAGRMEFSNQKLNKFRGEKVEHLVNLFTIMKKILFALSMLAFAVSALPQARADVSIDFFYDNLSGGNWIEVEGYGYGWQPDLAVSDPNWRPYADGYWAYTDYGWTWISYEDFGWATYHYGRWANLADYGWVWFPGSDLEWGPAWVSWRTGGDYIGWAPLPPRGPDVVYEGQPIGANVDVTFDIGPEYYNFCDVRFIGEPVLRDRIFPPVQNVTYITNTVNVTNITVQNNVVYNYGPNFNVVNQYSSRPIQRLTIERETPDNLSATLKSGRFTKVQGNKLLVAAPQKIAKAPPTAKPPAVKARVEQPKIQHGWKGVPNEAELKEKIRNQNPKNIPPPTRAAVRAGGSPAQAGKEKEAGMKELQAEQEKNRINEARQKDRQPRPGAKAMPGTGTGGVPRGTSPDASGPIGRKSVSGLKSETEVIEKSKGRDQRIRERQTKPGGGDADLRVRAGAPANAMPPTNAPTEKSGPKGKPKGQFERGAPSPGAGASRGASNLSGQGAPQQAATSYEHKGTKGDHATLEFTAQNPPKAEAHKPVAGHDLKQNKKAGGPPTGSSVTGRAPGGAQDERQRVQSPHTQEQLPGRVGAPANSSGQPEHGKRAGKGTPPPRPQ
jgi:hypothetical protein